MLLLALIAPAAGAAGVNQGSSDEVNYYHQEGFVYTPLRSSVSFPVLPTDSANALYMGQKNGGDYYVYQSAGSASVYLFFVIGTGFYVASSESGQKAMMIEPNATNRWDLNVYDNGYSMYVRYMSQTSSFTNIPSTIPKYANYDSAMIDLVGSISAGAVLVPDDDSFAFNSDYSVNNTTGVDIAVASYNLGYNDIIVIGCYETVVVPGTIGGLSANYNVNQMLPREEHIPIRYCALPSDTTFSSLTPYDSLEDAVSACYDVLQDSPNHGGGFTPSNVQFTLEPGNVAYIEMADLTKPVLLSSSKSSYSALFQTAGSYWPGNQLYKSGMDYPSTGTVLPGATPNQIPWQKNEWGKENLLGQTKQAYAEITASSNLLMIYNPYYQGDDSSTLVNNNLINSTIVIASEGISRNGIRVYNLQDSFSTVDGNYYYGIGSTSPNGYDDYFQSQNDPNATNPDVTGWTDENGDPTTAPGVTPYNDPPENDSIADVITKFISNITGLFTQGHEAIKTLSENASEFVSHLSELYSWLPPQVLAVLTSAIILAIIIGVLKVFL